MQPGQESIKQVFRLYSPSPPTQNDFLWVRVWDRIWAGDMIELGLELGLWLGLELQAWLTTTAKVTRTSPISEIWRYVI